MELPVLSERARCQEYGTQLRRQFSPPPSRQRPLVKFNMSQVGLHTGHSTVPTITTGRRMDIKSLSSSLPLLLSRR